MGFSLLLSAATYQAPATEAPVVAPVAPTPGHLVTLTAYNAVPSQTDSDPFETASGAYSNPEVVAARSRDLATEMPFGTIIEIDGSTITPNNTCGFAGAKRHIGYRVIADTMHQRFTDRIDILFDNETNITTAGGTEMNVANVLGICKGATVRVVGHVDIRHMPKTQAELAVLVAKGGDLAVK